MCVQLSTGEATLKLGEGGLLRTAPAAYRRWRNANQALATTAEITLRAYTRGHMDTSRPLTA
jgi:hypothetical protein